MFHPVTIAYSSEETLEAAVIVSVLLSFIQNAIGGDELALKKRLIKQVFPYPSHQVN